VNALFAFGLLVVFRDQAPETVRSEWFLFLGMSALLVLFAVRSTGPFWVAPLLSGPLAAAMTAAVVVTVLLVNLPATQQLLGFVTLDPLLQLGLFGVSVVYVLLADASKLAFRRLLARRAAAPLSPATR
jgi:Mg2+-importing ATPase